MRSHSQLKRNAADGAYYSNQFFMILDADSQFFTKTENGEDVLDLTFLDLFTHEYWHYWLNFSTIAGYKLFAYTQNLLYFFNKTLMGLKNGESEGNTALNFDEIKDLENLIVMSNCLEGNINIEHSTGQIKNGIFITNISTTDIEVDYDQRKLPICYVDIEGEGDVPSGSKAPFKIIFGSYAIEEGISIILEEIIANKAGKNIEGTFPEFPYLLLPKVYSYIAEEEVPSKYLLAALGTLSLLSTQPGCAFINIVKSYINKRKQAVDIESLLSIAKDLIRISRADIEFAISTDFPDLIEMHKGRGLIELGMRYLYKLFNKAIRKRLEHPFFDLDIFYPDFDTEKLMKFQEEYKPCDILQCRHGPRSMIMRDQIYGIGRKEVDELGFSKTDYFRTFQSQQDYVFCHTNALGLKFEPSNEIQNRCPFYTCCDLEFRVKNPDICAKEPWKTYDSKETCWYGIGVSATMGTVIASKKIPGDRI